MLTMHLDSFFFFFFQQIIMTRIAKFRKKHEPATPFVSKDLKADQQRGDLQTRIHNNIKNELNQNKIQRVRVRCFVCNSQNHKSAKCSKLNQKIVTGTQCYKCGSKEHNLKDCTVETKELNCICYICKQKGHLSRDCEQNPNGIYKNGGECLTCKSKRHLQRDCPENPRNKKNADGDKSLANTTTVGLITLSQGGDDDDYNISLRTEASKQRFIQKSSLMPNNVKKVVKF
jgi:hypothetical protein